MYLILRIVNLKFKNSWKKFSNAKIKKNCSSLKTGLELEIEGCCLEIVYLFWILSKNFIHRFQKFWSLTPENFENSWKYLGIVM
jgi:hypothetical protein